MKTILRPLFAFTMMAFASHSLAEKLWQENLAMPELGAAQLNAKADNARYVNFQHPALQKQFYSGDSELNISIPTPDGGNISVKLIEDSVMQPGIAAKFPTIKSYKAINETGQQIGRFSFSHKGLHGMYLHNNQWAYLDPLFTNQTEAYISY